MFLNDMPKFRARRPDATLQRTFEKESVAPMPKSRPPNLKRADKNHYGKSICLIIVHKL